MSLLPTPATDSGKLRFSNLKIRPKLIVLHNVFFLVLTLGVYFSLIPLIETRIAQVIAAHPELARDSADLASVVNYARWMLAGVLLMVYGLAVAALEFLIMPRYVYRPIVAFMNADLASRHGRVDEEMVPEEDIPGDEIGEIMHSRNATVAQLRAHEAELEQTLARLEDLNQDLIRKNYLLEAAKRNIADQDRLVSLGLLIASVAHEINTPLAVLHGSIEKMLETVPGAQNQERLARMLRVTQRLQKMSVGLLDFSRPRPLDVVESRIRAIIEESWGLVAIDEKAAEVRFENLAPEDMTVIGDPDRLIQLFVNLLRNALHAVAAGRGRITVRAAEAPAGENEDPATRWTAISVEDNGPGIPTDTLSNIFEAFVTTRLDARGTGLGLTVAEGIATEHGGCIRAFNQPGSGACLQVRLPAPRHTSPQANAGSLALSLRAPASAPSAASSL